MVPDYPHSTQWSELLLWCVQVMDIEDPELSFAASMLAQAIDKGGLTDRQAVYAARILKRLHDLWARGELMRQRHPEIDMTGAPRDKNGKVVMQ